MATVIQVEGLSKSYLISHRAREPYRTLRDAISTGARHIARGLSGRRDLGAGSETKEEFWALRDVDFKVEEGERVGIIGRNGAGKSTLLKILSRITEPTRGRVSISGRVASLLEVGTGFHPELTGRENIYLNGAVLGMTRDEVRRKFDQIVAFADVERFLDTPVKRYSSGMYVRLAFAVAAHLEPDILVVDEVLSVGDAQFQKKCIGKMEEVGASGRTVLFVSHNLPTVLRLCSRSLLMENGNLTASGDTRTVIQSYLDSRTTADSAATALLDLPRPEGIGQRLRITDCSIVNSDDVSTNRLLFGEPFAIRVQAIATHAVNDVSIVLGLDTQSEFRIATLASEDASKVFSCASGGALAVAASPMHLVLKPGRYLLTVGARHGEQPLDYLPQVLSFDVDRVPWRGAPSAIDTWGVLHVPTGWAEVAATGRTEELGRGGAQGTQ